MKRICIVLILGLLLQLNGNSQHFPIYSQYMMNGLAINPAYAGSRDVLSATFLYRKQWVGFDGAPTIYSMAAHMPFRNQRVALGFLIGNESIGIENNTSLFGNYAYRVNLGNGKLALGLKAGFNLIKEQNSKITLHDPNSDNAFENIKETAFMPNFGFGMYFSNVKYFLGFSVPTFLNYKSNGEVAETDMKSYNLLLTGGYLLKVSDQIKLKPSTLVKYKFESLPQYDLNLNVILFKDDILWVGASYRNKIAFIYLVEVQLSRKFRLGYSFDQSIGKLRTNGSHEIMIRYEWRDKVRTLNPLYF